MPIWVCVNSDIVALGSGDVQLGGRRPSASADRRRPGDPRAEDLADGAHTVYGGHEHVLRQTVIALVGGSRLEEHENPGEATGHVRWERGRPHFPPEAVR